MALWRDLQLSGIVTVAFLLWKPRALCRCSCFCLQKDLICLVQHYYVLAELFLIWWSRIYTGLNFGFNLFPLLHTFFSSSKFSLFCFSVWIFFMHIENLQILVSEIIALPLLKTFPRHLNAWLEYMFVTCRYRCGLPPHPVHNTLKKQDATRDKENLDLACCLSLPHLPSAYEL